MHPLNKFRVKHSRHTVAVDLIASHLSNIASTVVTSVSVLGVADKCITVGLVKSM
jgi:hypothetical protein